MCIVTDQVAASSPACGCGYGLLTCEAQIKTRPHNTGVSIRSLPVGKEKLVCVLPDVVQQSYGFGRAVKRRIVWPSIACQLFGPPPGRDEMIR
jgi:hypothetical protein